MKTSPLFSLRKKSKIFFLFLIFVFMFIGVKKFYIYKVDHFTLRQIRSTSWHYEPFPIDPTTNHEMAEIKQILSQPFFYLSKGKQSYVFESKDHKYVIKFLKQNHFRKKSDAKYFFSPQKKIVLEKQNQHRKESLKSILDSYLLAYQKLRKETGLIYINLNKELPPQPVTLIDKLGFPYHIPIHQFEFVLQKKVIPSENYFLEISNLQIGKAIDAVMDAIEMRCKKNILDLDQELIQNMGFSQDCEEVIFLDFGFFIEDPSISQPNFIKEEKRRRLLTLKKWSEKNRPSLIPYIDQRL